MESKNFQSRPETYEEQGVNNPYRLKNKIVSLPCTIYEYQFLEDKRFNCENISIEILEHYSLIKPLDTKEFLGHETNNENHKEKD